MNGDLQHNSPLAPASPGVRANKGGESAEFKERLIEQDEQHSTKLLELLHIVKRCFGEVERSYTTVWSTGAGAILRPIKELLDRWDDEKSEPASEGTPTPEGKPEIDVLREELAESQRKCRIFELLATRESNIVTHYKETLEKIGDLIGPEARLIIVPAISGSPTPGPVSPSKVCAIIERMKAQIKSYVQSLSEAREERNRVLMALDEVEWVEYNDPDMGAQWFCPFCRRDRGQPHQDNCWFFAKCLTPLSARDERGEELADANWMIQGACEYIKAGLSSEGTPEPAKLWLNPLTTILSARETGLIAARDDRMKREWQKELLQQLEKQCRANCMMDGSLVVTLEEIQGMLKTLLEETVPPIPPAPSAPPVEDVVASWASMDQIGPDDEGDQ